MRTFVFLLLILSFAGFSVSGCTSTFTPYSKPEAPWATIQRVAVLPFTTPFENTARQQVITQLFTEQIRRTKLVEVVEVPSSPPERTIKEPTLQEIAKQYEADAIFTGVVDDTQGTVVHIRLHDPATEEIIWSGTYSLGPGAEFFSLRTQQQQFQKSIRRIVREFSRKKR